MLGDSLIEGSSRTDTSGARHRYGSETRPGQVSVYSGPEPPSGGVRRPPLAVIAPHWTQFDAVTRTETSSSSSGTSYTWAGHMRTHRSPRSPGTRRLTLM